MVQESASNSPPELIIGQVLSERYRILAKLGEGAMAAVYLAEHTKVGTNIVLKVLLPDLLGNTELVQRFLQEAKIASEIHHDNIIDIFYSGRSPEGHVFLAMEYLPGTSLFELLERAGPMSWARAQPLLLQIADALEAAHGQGVVHRDVKPENVLVLDRQKPDGGSFEFVKVVDFGIANVGGGVAGQGVCGTPEYMAPEQARALPPDPRDDIYAFGCLMYQVLTGDVPFSAPSIQKVLLMHMQHPVETPRSRRPDLEIPAGAEAIVLQAMEKTRDRRFQSMAEVAEALAGVTVPRRMTAPVPTLAAEGLDPDAPAQPPERVLLPSLERPATRRLRIAARIGLAMLVVVLFTSAAILHHRNRPPGRFEVITQPADAEIYVDGQKMADRSPLMIDASPGRYTITVRRVGCDDVTQVVELGSRASVRVPLVLPISEGTRLELESDPPGALIWIDGRPVMAGVEPARTPFSAGRIAPGRHNVEMGGITGRETWHGEVKVILGSSRTLRGVLSRAPVEPDPHAGHRHRRW
jgi:tRNA A-37 threonylcarbamoyl transferase component Bud32